MRVQKPSLRDLVVFLVTAGVVGVGVQVGVSASPIDRSLRDPLPVTETDPLRFSEERIVAGPHLSYQKPVGFDAFLEPRTGSPGSQFGISNTAQTLVRKDDSARLIVSTTSGINAAREFDLADGPDLELVDGGKDLGAMYIWTEELTGQRGLAWILDQETIGWIFAERMSDEDMIRFAETVSVKS